MDRRRSLRHVQCVVAAVVVRVASSREARQSVRVEPLAADVSTAGVNVMAPPQLVVGRFEGKHRVLLRADIPPSMKHAGPIRERWASGDIQLLGPLTTRGRRDKSSAFHGQATQVMARARCCSAPGAWVVHGAGGLDEIRIPVTRRCPNVAGAVHTFFIHPGELVYGRPRPIFVAGGG